MYRGRGAASARRPRRSSLAPYRHARGPELLGLGEAAPPRVPPAAAAVLMRQRASAATGARSAPASALAWLRASSGLRAQSLTDAAAPVGPQGAAQRRRRNRRARRQSRPRARGRLTREE